MKDEFSLIVSGCYFTPHCRIWNLKVKNIDGFKAYWEVVGKWYRF